MFKLYLDEHEIYVLWGRCIEEISGETPEDISLSCMTSNSEGGAVKIPVIGGFIIRLETDAVGIKEVIIGGTIGTGSGNKSNPWIIAVHSEDQTRIYSSSRGDLVFNIWGEWEEPSVEALIELLQVALLLKRKAPMEEIKSKLTHVVQLASEYGPNTRVTLITDNQVFEISTKMIPEENGELIL